MLQLAFISGRIALLSVAFNAALSVDPEGKTSARGLPGIIAGRKLQPQSVAMMEREVGKNGTMPLQIFSCGNLGLACRG